MSVHAVLVWKAGEVQGLVHQTQLWEVKVSSFYAGDSWLGECLQHGTNSFHSHFWFKGAWLHLTLLPAAMPGGLRAVLDGWSEDVFSLSCWRIQTVEYFGRRLLHPCHGCFAALSEQGCFLSLLLAQKLRGCWMLNKVSKKRRNHSVLMHLNAHIPKYVLTWQFGLSCLKQLMKFQLIQEKKIKELNWWCSVFSRLKRGGGMLPSSSLTVSYNSCLNCTVMIVIMIITAGSLQFFEGWIDE